MTGLLSNEKTFIACFWPSFVNKNLDARHLVVLLFEIYYDECHYFKDTRLVRTLFQEYSLDGLQERYKFRPMFFEIFEDFSLKKVVQKNDGWYLNKEVEWCEDSKVIKH